MSLLNFFKGITWRPVASYFFMLLLFLAILHLYAVEKLGIWGAVAIALPCSVILAWILFKRVIKPLNDITATAREMAGGKLDYELRIYTRDEIGALARSINDMARRLRSTIADITEERNRMRAVLNSMADGVIALDQNGRVMLINPVVEAAFGITQQSSYGKNILEVVRNYDLDQLLDQALRNNKAVTRELKMLIPEDRIYRFHVTPLQSRGQEGGGVVVLIRDITERKQLEQMRTEFVANISHELRTPLTSVQGYVETLLDGAMEDLTTGKKFLQIIDEETKRLSRLIDELLDLSKLEERRVMYRWQQVNLADTVNRVLTIFRPQIEEKQLEVNTDILLSLPPVQGDPDMLAQVVINLIDNAIKYTKAGGNIRVSLAAAGEDEIRLEVTDSGAGIPAESIPRIFERFYRVEKARARELGGVGLGLAIVKHMVKAHGGRIEVLSEVGRGSQFIVYLPVVKPDKPLLISNP
jgi:two-component system phosphate regulon sensor histidine kinase PhoR